MENIVTRQSAIDFFIKKVKLAQNSNAKDLRLTLEEAQDLVCAIATINSNQELIQDLNKKLDDIYKKVSMNITQTSGINGGGFKNEN